MLMVYILNDAAKNLKEIEKSIRQIEIINHKTKYLSINATIEAVRAGEAGESFQVVASEVRDLSNDTQRLAINIRSQVNQMSSTLNYAEEILQKVASIDMSTNILAKEQLDDMMKGLIDNSQQISNIVNDATRASEQFSKTARDLITDIQYQDRIRQDLNYIQETVDSLEHVNQYVQQKAGDLDKELTPEEIAKNLPYSFSKEIENITEDKEPISAGTPQETQSKEDNVELF
jgi:methyl-accepting chemotaxis protein